MSNLVRLPYGVEVAGNGGDVGGLLRLHTLDAAMTIRLNAMAIGSSVIASANAIDTGRAAGKYIKVSDTHVIADDWDLVVTDQASFAPLSDSVTSIQDSITTINDSITNLEGTIGDAALFARAKYDVTEVPSNTLTVITNGVAHSLATSYKAKVRLDNRGTEGTDHVVYDIDVTFGVSGASPVVMVGPFTGTTDGMAWLTDWSAAASSGLVNLKLSCSSAVTARVTIESWTLIEPFEPSFVDLFGEVIQTIPAGP